MIIKSFKHRLIFFCIFVVLVSFSFIAFFLDQNLEENSLLNIQATLVKQIHLIEDQLKPENFKSGDLRYLEPLVKAFGEKVGCRITVISEDGGVLADSERASQEIIKMENHLNRPEVNVALNGEIGVDTRYSSTLKIDMLYAASPIKFQNKIVGVLRLALPLLSVQKTLWGVRRVVIAGLFFAVILAFILGSFVASQIVKPINKMIQVSRKFATGDFSRRVSGYSNDEIGGLAVTLNKMAHDLEEKIKETSRQNQHLSAIFNSMIEGVIFVDKNSRILAINPTVEILFDVKKDEVEGKLFIEAVRNKDIVEVINDVLKGGRFVSRDLDLILPVQKMFQINASPIYENDMVSGCLVVIHDVTEIKRLEMIRRDFVANVSHELKTPLTSIKGFVETLLEGALEDKQNSRNFLKIIQEHTERLNNLINDLLDLSSIESNKIGLAVGDVKLKELTDGVLFGFKAQTDKRSIQVKNDLAFGLIVKADKNRIEQVLINLVDNAVKFNKDNGFIKISSQELPGAVKILVEDSGAGIPEKDIQRIFERFYRVDKARSRELGGTGLGLSIVKHIIETHNGSVGVKSLEGSGSIFWFILPR